MYNIGIDLGGTNIKVGVVDEAYGIIGRANLKTKLPRPAEAIADSIAEGVRLACQDAGITPDEVNSIGIGTPGTTSRESGIVIYAGNLGFRDTPLGALLRDRLGKEIYVENDANAAAYGEVLNGAAKGYSNVVVITLGTGVGGGIIMDGDIYTGFNNCAGELGHIVIEYGGEPCACGRRGCFEAYSSATALIRMTRRAMEQNPSSALWKIAGALDEVDGKTAFDGMRMGDSAAREVVDTYIAYLGCGLTNIVNIFQPEILLIGGGICKEGANLTDPLNDFITRESHRADPERTTKLAIAQLGNDAGIIGAACLYRLGK